MRRANAQGGAPSPASCWTERRQIRIRRQDVAESSESGGRVRGAPPASRQRRRRHPFTEGECEGSAAPSEAVIHR
jgi:hypothetical protein